MRYGIEVNALTLDKKTGVERYVDRLLRAMMLVPLREGDSVMLYVSKLPAASYQLPAGWEWRVLPFAFPKGWTHARLSWELLRHPPDVFFNPSHEIPLFVSKKTRVVSTVHDLAFHRVPDAYPPANRRRQETAIRRVVKKATRILAISEATKRDLIELVHADAAKITVTPLAVDANDFAIAPIVRDAVLARYRLSPERYVLFVGRLEEKKNVITLIRAFTELKKELGVGHPLELVLAGKWGYGEQRIKNVLMESRSASKGVLVHVLGFVPDADMAALYAGALCLCLPSLGEGFGLPVLESAAAGTPVIASDIPALREVMGDAALFAPATDVVAWTHALRRLVFEPAMAAMCVEKGKVRVAAFSWDATAQKTWDALHNVSDDKYV